MIQSRPDGSVDVDALDTTRKVSLRGPSRYSPLELCDKAVYEMAQHYYTADEIAKSFKVTLDTLITHHGDAFEAGKRDAHQKPRMLLKKLMDEYLAKASLTEPTLIPLGDGKFHVSYPDLAALQKAIEFHAKKYEGFGSTHVIEHRQEKPSASDIRFEPFKKEEQ